MVGTGHEHRQSPLASLGAPRTNRKTCYRLRRDVSHFVSNYSPWIICSEKKCRILDSQRTAGLINEHYQHLFSWYFNVLDRLFDVGLLLAENTPTTKLEKQDDKCFFHRNSF